MEESRPVRSRRPLVARLLRVAATAYLGFAALVYAFQDKLLFKPQPLSVEATAQIMRNHPGVKPVSIRTDDGATLNGWLVPGSAPAPQPLVIYFGGNAEEVSWMIDRQPRLGGWALLLVNYRGYGRSDGEPGEQTLFADAPRIYDFATAQTDVDRRRIVVMGRSLGTGIAVYLASQRAVTGVVLITPYDSMLAVAREHYSYLPVSLLLRHRFESIALAPAIHAPLLILAAAHDTVIPYVHAQRLQTNWAGPTQWHLLPGTDHLSISKAPMFWQYIRDFLSKLDSNTARD